MTRRFAWLILTAVLSLVALAGLAGVGMVTAQTETERTSFVVATGSTGGHGTGVVTMDLPLVAHWQPAPTMSFVLSSQTSLFFRVRHP